MRHRFSSRTMGLLSLVLVVGAGVGTTAAAGQAPSANEGVYFRAVADYFRVAPEEVAILREWNVSTEEVPVVLFVAGRAGVPPDVVVAIRQDGSSWSEVAQRYRLGAGAFYLQINDDGEGSLSRAYGMFNRTPQPEWPAILLLDREIVSLVNLRVISQNLAMPPSQVLAARDRVGSYVLGYDELRRERP